MAMDGGLSQMRVRKAAIEDAEAVADLLWAMHDEGKFPTVNVEKATAAILDVIEKGICLVVERADGRIVSSAGLALAPWWFSDEKFLFSFWLFTHQDARRSRATILLIHAINAAVESTGLHAMIDVQTLIEAGRKDDLFGRYWTPIGANYLVMPGAING